MSDSPRNQWQNTRNTAPVGPPPNLCTTGLVAKCGDGPWYRVGGWCGQQPLVWQIGLSGERELQMFSANKVVTVVYDEKLWKTARGYVA